MLTGSCACGSLAYRIDGGLIGPVTYCHCWRCRKHSGASFGTTAGIRADALHITAGAPLLAHWQSSPGVQRFFARCCGSPIYKRDAASPDILGFRLGTLDDDPGLRAAEHFHTGSKAPWVEIGDALPQERGGPPFGQRD